MKLILFFIHPWRLAGYSVFLALSLVFGDDNARARTFSDMFCDHFCPPIDRGLTAAEKLLQLEWARWKGRTQEIAPLPVAGRGPSCGRLPDAQSTARCCLDDATHLLIEFSGRNPYAYPETPWQAVCKPE